MIPISRIEKIIEAAATRFDKGFVDRMDARMLKAGDVSALIVGALSGVLVGLFVHQTKGPLEGILSAVIGIAIGLMISSLLVFIARKMTASIGSLLTRSRTEVSTSGYFLCLSLFGLLIVCGLALAAVALIVITGGAFEPQRSRAFGNLWMLILLCGGAVITMYYTALTLNPTILNVQVVKNATIGQEAVALASFWVKLAYKGVPIYYGVGMLSAAILSFASLWLPISGLFSGYLAIEIAIAAGTAPFTGYMAFLSVFVVIDVLRVILLIGRFLDNSMAGTKSPSSSAGPPPTQKAAASITPEPHR